MSLPFLPDDFLKPRLLVPCSFGVASLSADAADEGGASDDASDDASESCTGAARADAAREGCTREGCLLSSPGEDDASESHEDA